jgi:hypothetical protein
MCGNMLGLLSAGGASRAASVDSLKFQHTVTKEFGSRLSKVSLADTYFCGAHPSP